MSTDASIPAPAPVSKPVQTLAVAPATDTSGASATDASVPAPAPVSKPVQTLAVASATDTTGASATDASIPALAPGSKPLQTLAVAPATERTGASATDASIPAPAPVSKPVQTLAVAPATETTGSSTQVKEKGRNTSNCMHGYIFLCNGRTKPHCFQYCVFGLPISKKKTVKKIKPGTKLFLFDYEMRLLHGIYEATSEGKIDLESTAFEGKFPAQVKYRIVEDWPPLPEKSFRSAIKENYQGVKFRSELSEPQVNTLVLLFRMLSSSSSKSVALPFPNAAPPQAMLPLRIEDQYNHSIRLHSQGIVEPQPIQTIQIMQNQQHTAGALVDHVHPCFQHQSVPNLIDSYNAHSQVPYCTSGHTHIVQEPFPRYCSEGVPQYHTMGLGSDHHPLSLWSELLQQGHCPPQQENIWYHQEPPLFEERETTLNRKSDAACALVPTTDGILSTVRPYAPAYERPERTYPVPRTYVSSTMKPHAPASGRPVHTYPLPTDHYFSSYMQPYASASGMPELYYPLPTAPYVSSTMQPCNPASGRPEENYPMATASYASSTTQPYAPAFGRSEPDYPLPTAPFVSSTMQPYAPSFGRPEPNVSISSCFTFVGANQVIR